MRSSRIITAALLGAAVLAGPASAMPIDPPRGRSQPRPQPPIVQRATSSGFDWSSAGIGAAGGVGAFAIAFAAGAGMRHRRPLDHGRVITH